MKNRNAECPDMLTCCIKRDTVGTTTTTLAFGRSLMSRLHKNKLRTFCLCSPMSNKCSPMSNISNKCSPMSNKLGTFRICSPMSRLLKNKLGTFCPSNLGA